MKARLPEAYTQKGAGNMMKQAQQMQAAMAEAQQELQEKQYESASGGSMVKAVVNGKNEVVSVTIAPEVVDPEDVEMLQDLVIAAVNGAFAAAHEDYEKTMGGITGGFDLGGML